VRRHTNVGEAHLELIFRKFGDPLRLQSKKSAAISASSSSLTGVLSDFQNG
jgi:hypothetical protein